MSDKNFFCGFELKTSGIIAGYFTLGLGMVVSGVSISKFFEEDYKENEHSKFIAFYSACYCAYYVFCTRNLIYGIVKERRDKLTQWIIFSALNAVVFFSLAIAGLVFFCMNTFEGKIEPNGLLTYSAAFAITSIALSFFTWCGVTIYNYFKSGNSFIPESV